MTVIFINDQYPGSTNEIIVSLYRTRMAQEGHIFRIVWAPLVYPTGQESLHF